MRLCVAAARHGRRHRAVPSMRRPSWTSSTAPSSGRGSTAHTSCGCTPVHHVRGVPRAFNHSSELWAGYSWFDERRGPCRPPAAMHGAWFERQSCRSGHKPASCSSRAPGVRPSSPGLPPSYTRSDCACEGTVGGPAPGFMLGACGLRQRSGGLKKAAGSAGRAACGRARPAAAGTLHPVPRVNPPPPVLQASTSRQCRPPGAAPPSARAAREAAGNC